MGIPDPTAWANNLVQIEDSRRRWQQQVKDAEAAAQAQLWHGINGLMDAMNAYAEGYRRLVGELQDWPDPLR